mgnify:CR=1 FL=1
MKIRILFIALLAVLMTACGVLPVLDERETVASVAIADLLARPADYQGQFLCTSGIRIVAFEVNALAAKAELRDGHYYLGEPSIWLDGALADELTCVREQEVGMEVEVCQVYACGIFQTGGQFGNAGGYQHQLSRPEIPNPPGLPQP